MYFLGLDIGTTSVCAVVLDECGEVTKLTRPNECLAAGGAGEKNQDPDGIFAICVSLFDELAARFEICAVGVSGQMHGILYVGADGKAVSPLYSWQDERGNLPYAGSTYAGELHRLTGMKCASGFGTVSLFFDAINGRVPAGAAAIVTIGDYVAMRLCGAKNPIMSDTNAASLGLYDIGAERFALAAAESAGLPTRLFPETVRGTKMLGKAKNGAAVYAAVGDNQASVYGAENGGDQVIVNVGTGSQVSVVTDVSAIGEPCEVRPYFRGKYLVTGCALCGGRSYKLLKNFFESVTGAPVSYETMNKWAARAQNSAVPSPVMVPSFCGTRADHNARASITGLSEDNFNASALTLATLNGISGELKGFYEAMLPFTGKRVSAVGVGNGVRNNPVLRSVIERDFGCKLLVPKHKEEAAFGAALLAAETHTAENMKHLIRYE